MKCWTLNENWPLCVEDQGLLDLVTVWGCILDKLVRPILEYGQQASSPYLRRDIVLMQRIQRQATRMVKCMR